MIAGSTYIVFDLRNRLIVLHPPQGMFGLYMTTLIHGLLKSSQHLDSASLWLGVGERREEGEKVI
jgi:hypothetical protein